MKNLGYPVSMLSMTRFSFSSYPTVSRHVGRDTDIAWGVNGGTTWPQGPSIATCAISQSFDEVDMGRIRGEIHRK